MPHRGHVENGVIVLDDPLDLPEGTVVECWPLRPAPGHHHPDVERFGGVLAQSDLGEEDYMDYLRKKHL